MKLLSFLLTPLLALSLVSPSVTIQRSRKDIFKHTLFSTLKVTYDAGVDSEGDHLTGVCTAFIVDTARGWALTANHCIEPGKQLFVNETIPVEPIKQNEKDDLALLKIPAMMGPPLRFAENVEVLDEVLAIGYGYGIMQVEVRHVASFYEGDIHFDNALVKGMSGGPIVDLNGDVVGLAQWADTGISRGAGVKEMKDFLKKVK